MPCRRLPRSPNLLALLLVPALGIGCGGSQATHPAPVYGSTEPVPLANTIQVTHASGRLTPNEGHPGTRISIKGSGMQHTCEILFGLLPGEDLLVLSDAEVSVRVPAGAGSGPLRVSATPNIDLVDGGVFTVLPAPRPNPDSFTAHPARVVPEPPAGTGSRPGPGLLPSAGMGPEPARDSRFTEPLGIELIPPGPGHTGGSSSEPTPEPQPAPLPAPPTGRRALLEQPFAVAFAVIDGPSRFLDFNGARRTAQYADMALPAAPMLHPYDPWSYDNGSVRPGMIRPEFTLNMRLPAPFWEAVPSTVTEKLTEMNIALDRCELLCVSQNQPWTGVPVLYRPHYWTDPDAPYSGTYSREQDLRFALIDAVGGLTVAGEAAANAVSGRISTHGNGPNTLILSSPDNFPVGGLHHETSRAIWSVLALPDGRAAVTLHLVLNDADQATLSEISQWVGNLRELMEALGTDAGGPAPVFRVFREWTAPVLRQVNLGSGAQTGPLRVTLEGTGMTGVTTVLVHGLPATDLVVSGDTSCSVTLNGLPAGATITAISTLGASRPVPLQ